MIDFTLQQNNPPLSITDGVIDDKEPNQSDHTTIAFSVAPSFEISNQINSHPKSTR